MRQFDLFQNPSERSRPVAPFVAVLQSHLFEGAPTVLVAPLLIDDGRTAYSEASVALAFADSQYVLSVIEMAGIERGRLRTAVGSLAEHEDAIRRVPERLFTGF